MIARRARDTTLATPGVSQLAAWVASRRPRRTEAELDKLKEQRRQLVEDEKRLRDNLAAVGRDTALYKQTLEKLGETEATITTLSSAAAKAAVEIETAKEQLWRARKNTGNFIDSRLGSASTAAKKHIKPKPYGSIPYAPEQGIFAALQGI